MAAYIVGVEERAGNGRRRVYRARVDALAQYSDDELYKKYRFSRQGIQEIIRLIGDDLDHDTDRSHELSSTLQILIALNFFGTGAVFDSVATMHGMHRSSVSRSVHNVASALCRQRNNVSKIKLNNIHFHF